MNKGVRCVSKRKFSRHGLNVIGSSDNGENNIVAMRCRGLFQLRSRALRACMLRSNTVSTSTWTLKVRRISELVANATHLDAFSPPVFKALEFGDVGQVRLRGSASMLPRPCGLIPSLLASAILPCHSDRIWHLLHSRFHLPQLLPQQATQLTDDLHVSGGRIH